MVDLRHVGSSNTWEPPSHFQQCSLSALFEEKHESHREAQGGDFSGGWLGQEPLTGTTKNK